MLMWRVWLDLTLMIYFTVRMNMTTKITINTSTNEDNNHIFPFDVLNLFKNSRKHQKRDKYNTGSYHTRGPNK